MRDHRKLLVVDGSHGFTGGINLAAPWLPPDEGGAGWRDDMIEVRGEAAQELRTLFFHTWRKLTGESPPPDVRPLSRRRTRPVWVLASQWRDAAQHAPRVRRAHPARARERVDIANSYFVPDRRVRARPLPRRRARRARARARAREERRPVVQFAVEALFDTLLRHGVEIYVLPGTMLHAKTAIIDDAFTTIGSYNLDERSWRKNLEVNLAVEDPRFARHVRDLVRARPRRATRVELDDLARPLARPARLRVGGVRDEEALVSTRREAPARSRGSDRGLRRDDGRDAPGVPGATQAVAAPERARERRARRVGRRRGAAALLGALRGRAS